MELITNRTLADVERVKELSGKGWNNLTEDERAEWLGGMKGAYNYTDLNRVESTVQMLGNALGLGLMVKTNWNVSDNPTKADIDRYLGNISALKSAIKVQVNTHDVPKNLNGMTHETANQIEQILVDLMSYIDTWCKCGEIFCGEV